MGKSNLIIMKYFAIAALLGLVSFNEVQQVQAIEVAK